MKKSSADRLGEEIFQAERRAVAGNKSVLGTWETGTTGV